MGKIVKIYSNKIRDSNSNSVSCLDNWFICKLINNQWHIIEGHDCEKEAISAHNILVKHDLKYGHIKTMYEYKIFQKGYCVIIYPKDI